MAASKESSRVLSVRRQPSALVVWPTPHASASRLRLAQFWTGTPHHVSRSIAVAIPDPQFPVGTPHVV